MTGEHRKQVGKMLVASAIMGVVLVPFARMEVWESGLSPATGGLLAAAVILGGALYFALLWLLGMRGFLTGRRPR